VATYKDIQRQTGLSLSTISKYFNGRNLLDGNRAAIDEAVRALDFRPNGFAQNLRSRRSQTVGVLLPALDNDFHLTIIAGVEEALRRRGMSVIVASSPTADDGAVDLLLSRMVDGIIAVAPDHDAPALRSAAERVPVVMVDWAHDDLDLDGVFLDNVAAGALAAGHLLNHGHRRIALVGGDPAISSMRLRVRGFQREIDRELGAHLEVRVGPLTSTFGHRAASQLLAAHPRPTAIFASNYELTVGSLIAVNESGLRLGRDISLLGFDGVELSRLTVPKLTIVAQPTRDIAARAAQLIYRRITHTEREDPHAELLAPELLFGGSIARLDDDAPGDR